MADQTPDDFLRQFRELKDAEKRHFDDTPTQEDIARRRAGGQYTIEDFKNQERQMELPPPPSRVPQLPPMRMINLHPVEENPYNVMLHPMPDDFHPFGQEALNLTSPGVPYFGPVTPNPVPVNTNRNPNSSPPPLLPANENKRGSLLLENFLS